MRDRLDQAGLRRRLHRIHEAQDGVALHVAVGVIDDHVIVATAPAGDEVPDVAGLAVQVDRPAAVADLHIGRADALHPLKRRLFPQRNARIRRVAENETLEIAGGIRQALRRGQHRREDLVDILVVDRERNHRPRARNPADTDLVVLRAGNRQRRTQPDNRIHERKAHPADVQREHREQGPFKQREAGHREHLEHLVRRPGCHQHGRREHEHLAPGVGLRTEPVTLRRRAAESLVGHGHGKLDRTRAGIGHSGLHR